jgi:hypothetical protein
VPGKATSSHQFLGIKRGKGLEIRDQVYANITMDSSGTLTCKHV